MKKLVPFLLSMFIFCCKKEASHEASAQDKQTAAEVQAFVSGRAFRVASYTASVPVDYYPDDTIGLTKDLWQFVSNWIKDDSTYFEDGGNLIVYQNKVRFPEEQGDPISRNWSIGADDSGVHLNYLSYIYDPLTYNYVSHTDSTLTIQVPRGNVQLITILKVLK